jgi:hypothetical protein
MNGAQGRKPASGRPSQESVGYVPFARKSNEGTQGKAQLESQIRMPSPKGKVIFEGYRKDILNNFEGENPRWNPVRILRRMAVQLWK